MELEKVVQAELDSIVADGTIQKIVRKQLEATVTSIINDTLRDYSDFGKELKNAVKDAMKIDFERMKLTDYNHIVTGIVRDQLDKTLLENATKPIVENLKKYLGGLDKTSWKLSEIITEFSKELGEDGEAWSINLKVEEDNINFCHIYFDSEKRKYNSEYRFNINLYKGEIFGFKAGNYTSVSHKLDLKQQNLHRGFDAFVFRLYASGATIEVDEDDCQTESYND